MKFAEWLARHLAPELVAFARVVFVGNGGLKPMSAAVEQALRPRLTEVVYGEAPTASIMRSRSGGGVEFEAYRHVVRLDEVLNCSGHQLMGVAGANQKLWDGHSPFSELAIPDLFRDLDALGRAVSKAWQRERADTLDPSKLSHSDVTRLFAPHEEGRRLLQLWQDSFEWALRRAIDEARDDRLHDRLEADEVDVDGIESTVRDWQNAAQSIGEASQQAIDTLATARATGLLDDDQSSALLAASNSVRTTAKQLLSPSMKPSRSAMDKAFQAAVSLKHEAEIFLSDPAAIARSDPLGPVFEQAVAARVLHEVARHPAWHGAIGEVWLNVHVAERSTPAKKVAEYDVLLVMKNGILVNIECKAGPVKTKDMDARKEVQKRAASTRAEMWICSLLPTSCAAEMWFDSLHATRRGALAADRKHLPYTWAGQAVKYVFGKEEFECPSFESALASLVEPFVPLARELDV